MSIVPYFTNGFKHQFKNKKNRQDASFCRATIAPREHIPSVLIGLVLCFAASAAASVGEQVAVVIIPLVVFVIYGEKFTLVSHEVVPDSGGAVPRI